MKSFTLNPTKTCLLVTRHNIWSISLCLLLLTRDGDSILPLGLHVALVSIRSSRCYVDHLSRPEISIEEGYSPRSPLTILGQVKLLSKKINIIKSIIYITSKRKLTIWVSHKVRHKNQPVQLKKQARTLKTFQFKKKMNCTIVLISYCIPDLRLLTLFSHMQIVFLERWLKYFHKKHYLF